MMNRRYLLFTVMLMALVMIIATDVISPIVGAFAPFFGVLIYQRFDKTTKTTPKVGALIGVLSGLCLGVVMSLMVILLSDEGWSFIAQVVALYIVGFSFYGAIAGAIGGAIFKPKSVGRDPSTGLLVKLDYDHPVEESDRRFKVGLKTGLVTSLLLAPVATVVIYLLSGGAGGESLPGFLVLELFCLAGPVGIIGGGLGAKYFFTGKKKRSWVVGAGVLGGLLAVFLIHLAFGLMVGLSLWAEGYQTF